MNVNVKTGLAGGLLVSVLVALAAGACGGEEKRPETPPTPSATPPTTSATASATPVASASAPTSATASASAAPPPAPPKGKFATFTVSANSGKVDKIGNKDGAFKPDGVKDLVFETEFEGAATALLIVSTDSTGQPNGEFNADTFVGDQQLPTDLAANLNQGKFTGGVGVYEGDKLLNAKDGSLTALSEGKHKLVLYISSKDAPKGSYKALAVFADKSSVASSPVATK